MELNQMLGVLDVVGALVLLWTNQRMTHGAGWHDRSSRWALIRRFIYSMMALSLFVLGLYRFTGQPATAVASLAQMGLLFGIMFYPVLRSFGYVTQDALIEVLGSDVDSKRTKDRHIQHVRHYRKKRKS